MSTEQQARLRFLEEAETYFEQIETVILRFNTSEQRTQDLDIAMRAAHSVKGTAAMMDYGSLSQIAHRMEDYFKILRARNLGMETVVETLLLQGLDSLRMVQQRLYEHQPIEDEWQATHVIPIFEQLRQHLGELTPEDEDRLLSAEEEVDVSVMVFTNGLDGYLEQLETKRPLLKGDDLRQELITGASQLMDYGLMAEFDDFVGFCTSILDYAPIVAESEIEFFGEQVIQTWKRSHSLVSLGRMEQLANALPDLAAIAAPDSSSPDSDPIDQVLNHQVLSDQTSAPDAEPLLSALDEQEAAALHTAISAAIALTPATLDLDTAGLDEVALDEVGFDGIAEEIAVDGVTDDDISALQDQLAQLDWSAVSDPEYAQNKQSQPEPSQPEQPQNSSIPTPLPQKTPRRASETTVRIPVEQLQAINQLLGTLILDRNAITLQLEQLQSFASLLKQRVSSIETFNTQLRQWYDRSSSEGLASAVAPEKAAGLLNPLAPASSAAGSSTAASSTVAPPSQAGGEMAALTQAPLTQAHAGFDTLEMDQYSNLHLLVQDNIETIVKLQEVSADIGLGVQAIDQATGRLNYTSRSLQEQINRAQMRPFEDIVGRFPRVIRDLSTTHGKKVNLVLEGESTLFERYALDSLTDPLLHLLRNAFDHGIETPEIRQANGKPVEGSIRLKAMSRGNRAIITLNDDGGGIDLDKIRDRVRTYGIPDEHIQQMDRQELLELIFEPGFTTTTTVTDLSGRGVGMDVVRSNLREIKGTIQVDTEWGQGTTFTITIPLSLSLLRVLFLEQSNFMFAVSAEDVKTMIPFDAQLLTQVDGQESILWDKTPIPLIRLEQHWHFSHRVKAVPLPGKPTIERPLVVIIGDGDRSYGLLLHRFWREQDVVIRSLDTPLHLPQGFGGATVLGDGRVIPLLDPPQLRDWVWARRTELLEESEVTTFIDTSEVEPTDLAPEPPTILVVDDSVHARQYLAISLDKAGYVVEQAKDGREAVDLLMAGLQVDAIVCDVEMPRLDGYGVLDALKSQPRFQGLPIMMLTSRSSEKHRKLAMNLGASAYFSKPYNEQELLRMLETWVSRL